MSPNSITSHTLDNYYQPSKESPMEGRRPITSSISDSMGIPMTHALGRYLESMSYMRELLPPRTSSSLT
ncbi:hypothetical protein LINGRAHAP2_LOCUS34749 [Linum grandiflorum]